MSCGINNPVVVVYEIDSNGIRMPSKYNENDLVGDMIRMIEVPINKNMADEPTVYDETAEPTETPLVPVVPNPTTTPSPITFPTTTTPAPPTVEITTSMLAPTTTSTTTTPNATTTSVEETTTSSIPTTTSIPTTITEITTSTAEYFTNKLKCSDKKNHLLFGIIIIILIFVLVLIIKKNLIKNIQ